MWCLDKLWFYSETKLYDNQFGYCKFTETWADSKVVLRSGSEWLGVYNEDSRIDCDLGEKRVLQKMSYKVCPKSHAGSSSEFYATIENGNGEKCTTPLRPNKEKYKPNEYIEMNEINGK